MQKILKQASPIRQLFETLNFAFMNISVKIAIFRASLLFLSDSCHKLQAKIDLGGYLISSIIKPQSLIFACNFLRQSPKKSRDALKMAILTEKIKNFHKSKVEGLKNLSPRACPFYNLLHFRGYLFTKGEILEKSII